MAASVRGLARTLTATTLSWPVKGEDRLFEGSDLAAVIDGAGSPKPISIDGLSGGAWIAQALLGRFAGLKATDIGLDRAVLAMNEEIEADLRQRQIDTGNKASVPAASLVACSAGRDDALVRLVQVGDCQAFVAAGGGARPLFVRQQEPFDRSMQEAVRAARQRGENEQSIKDLAARIEIENRFVMNTPGGYGTIAGDRGVSEFIRCDAVPLQPVVLTSDGLFDILSADEARAAVAETIKTLSVAPLAAAIDARLGETVPPDDISVLVFVPAN